jgi:hypothetical protein
MAGDQQIVGKLSIEHGVDLINQLTNLIGSQQTGTVILHQKLEEVIKVLINNDRPGANSGTLSYR